MTQLLLALGLFLSLLSASICSPGFIKGSAESVSLRNVVKPISEGSSSRVLHSKDTFNSVESAIDLHKNAPGPMKITCLTIGSRGDVQPYIALCQKLNELGHTCTIATHQKFEHWIAESGVGFRPVAGDPTELIKHCTQNGEI